MARRKTLTDNMVARIKPGAKRLMLPDPELRGHYIRVTPKGSKSYVAMARDPDGKQVWATIDGADMLAIAEAREKARSAIHRIKAGQPAFEPPPVPSDSFKAVADNWLHRHVQAKGLRSAPEIRRILSRYIYPVFQHREFASIKRSDVTKLLDLVEDGSGPRQADTVLATLSSIMNWHATRSDNYTAPLVRGMRRDDGHAQKRARILNDDEIRAVWTAAEGTFAAFIKLAILTGQRRRKLTEMRWQDVTIDGTWNIPTEDREKGNGGSLALPEIAVDIIRSQKRIGGNPYVFAGRGDGHYQGFSPAKRSLDAKVSIASWTVHDLRRTSRSLMARAGVQPQIAEKIMGHVLPGVEGVYNRHEYEQEKAAALAKLAGLIALILDPPGENVVTLKGEAAQ